MWRNTLILVILSIVAVLLLHQIDFVISFLQYASHNLSLAMTSLFNSEKLALISAKVIFLILIPALVALVISGIYYLIRKQKMPWTSHVVWICWIVLATFLATQYGNIS